MMLKENVVGYVDKRSVCIKVTIEPMLVNEVSEVQCKMSQSHGEKERGQRRQRGDPNKRSLVPVWRQGSKAEMAVCDLKRCC